MKTQKAKEYLKQALSAMPNDFALFDARQHIKIAINKIIEIEDKRKKREYLKEKRTQKFKLKANSINVINKMIEIENDKLKDFEKEKNE
jgi:hypothetical protein